jgi:hypothetical protein
VVIWYEFSHFGMLFVHTKKNLATMVAVIRFYTKTFSSNPALPMLQFLQQLAGL